ncbi:hypothetical protein MGU_01383 [Metarhizium guizhouense ARSEF 977]|uniref:Uncharacterized protein n=1 Tax=Metarhizium guizhouense (strain ARSEF 977) TaxID=1276136 RepID=A0A0B4H7S6_METGA|nr:hypothetical protein MGU_01383 [Metarhizium guizhouense ARSEF 977]
MAFTEQIEILRREIRGMEEFFGGLSVEAVEENSRLTILQWIKRLCERAETMIQNHEDGIKAQQVAALETELQVSESAQARLRSELDRLQRTFDTRLQDQVKAETEAIQARLTERMEKQFDSRFIALATEVRRADAEASPCQMEREKRLDEKEERLHQREKCLDEKEKRLAEQGAALTVRETSLQETRDDVNRRSRELVASRQDQLDKVQTLLDTELSAIKSRLESLDRAVVKREDVGKLQETLNEQQAALRGLPSKSDVESAVSGLPVLQSLVGAASGLQSAAMSQQDRLGELLSSQRETLAVLNDAVDAVETKVGLVHEAVEDHDKAVSLQFSAVGDSVDGIGRRLDVEGGLAGQQAIDRLKDGIDGIGRRLEVEGGLAGQQAVDRLKDDVAGLSRVARRLPTASHVARSLGELKGSPDNQDGFITYDVFVRFAGDLASELCAKIPHGSTLLSEEQVHAIVSSVVSDLATMSDLESRGLLDGAHDRVQRRDITDLTTQVSQAIACHDAALGQLRQTVSDQALRRFDFLNLASKVGSIRADLSQRSDVAELKSIVLQNNEARDLECQAQSAELAKLSAKVDGVDSKLANTNLAEKADLVELTDTVRQADSARDKLVQNEDIAVLGDKVEAMSAWLMDSDYPKGAEVARLATRILSQDADREIASQEVCQAVSAMSESLAQHLEVLTNWQGTATPDSLQTALGELSETIASIKQQIDGTSEVVDQISSDLGKLGGPTPPSTTEAGKPQWLYKYQSLRFWDSAIDRAISDLAILNVVGAENMEPKHVCQLLLDTLQPDNLDMAMHLVDSGPSEYWFCFRGICNGEEIEPENGLCPIHGNCILVKRTHFDNEMGQPRVGLKFRRVCKAV